MSYTTKPSNRKIRHYKYIPLEPQIDEILSRGQEDIYRNVVKGNYKSPVHHLNVHFKLLREDFIAPLREGIHEMRREFTEYGELHQNQYITLYPKCRFICMAARKKVVGYDFCFDVDLKMKNNQWRTTRSLFNGTLLAFSCDNFKTFFFGFVVFTDFHEMLYRRVITVDLCNGRHLEFNEFSPSYAMIEPSSFFAPFLYVMKTLQTFSNENFPFANYVIHSNRHIKAPVYFNKHSSILDAYDLSANVQEESSFFAPYLYVMKTLQTFSNENFPFANYVIHANRHIKAPVFDLTREFAIIQGPPGTGKTYVALRIVEGFLKNKELARYMSGPILIVCYTNHALDQFVEGVLKYTQNVCRLGYSRNNNKVKPYNYLQMIETFYAISDAIKSVKKGGKKQKAMAQIEDFDSIFSPDKHGKYTMRVRSFKTETYEQRTYDAQLMKAYFFMFIKSPFNIPSSFPKKGILKSCHGCEDHIERISYKINLVNSLSGIVNAKYLEQFMDDVSQFVFKTPGALEAWLTNGNFQLSLSQLRKEQIARNQMSSTSESEDEYDYESSSSSENSMDRCEEVFYTLDVGQIENEIELSMELLRDMQNEQSRNRFVVDSTKIELQNKVERLQTLCQLVKGSLYALSHGNVNLKEIESTIIKNISSSHDLTSMNMGHRWELYWYWLESYRRLLYTQMKSVGIRYKRLSKARIKNISSSHDLTSMNMGHRWELYWYWLESYRRLLYTQMKSVGIRYKRLSRQFEESIRNPELLSILKTKDVIAMTTTKAAKIHSVLCELKPKIVVIEEAAEVLETHILASLSKHSEHVVLIGDHKQLRPRTCIYELARDFYFDVSLFERMINNDLPHVTLQVQHRMRPEICELLTPNIYDTLINHPSVTKLPNVKGMPMNVQFFDHKETFTLIIQMTARRFTSLPGTKVSAVRSLLLTSTGIITLDPIIGGGIPVGTIALLGQQKAEEEVTSGLARLNLSSKTISSPKKSNVDLPPENLPVEMSYTTKPSNRKIRHYKYIPLEPQIDEILSRGQEDIYRNVVKGNYKSPVHHLNVHFKLLREDFIAPLREVKCNLCSVKLVDNYRDFHPERPHLHRNMIIIPSDISGVVHQETHSVYNVHNNVGFLKTVNRVCVALSRAKQGLFIMGNMKCLSADSQLWQEIKNKLVTRRSINESFRLQCNKHRAVTIIRAVEDFEACCCLTV
ncbi:LOW QUALITY PROTEIN: NFX1-type zinc finger-containing protein 1-like [Diaphorina citri]|uniref:LOW QUALITY PROTEIN: NFX1-type zinc finger-containing protein 1-like n=1 Tax=Diaphorina citri TaxID=121845 RepID=A0A3Q0JC05_DIACI|nr:LOW QUALITY PROTEIN: NFX1-type zinc finger-containing protein 1-like [Diaphorina citri]